VSGIVGVGEFVFERSSSETQSILVAMERRSVEHWAFAVETYFKNNDSVVVTQRIFRRHSIFIGTTVSLTAVLLPLRISQEQDVRKGNKDNGGFKTEHQGRSGSNFSQHAAVSDAELQKRFRECVDKGHHLRDTIFRK
jgi:hypothetical protein